MDHDPSEHIPPGWSAIFSPPPTTPRSQTYGRGLAIVVATTSLIRSGLRFEYRQFINNDQYQLLAASIGRCLIISAYIFCSPQHPSSVYTNLAADITRIQSQAACHSLIVAGDFNHSESVDTLQLTLSALDLEPALAPTIPTRLNNHLDNIYSTSSLTVGPATTQLPAQGDHLMVVGSATMVFCPTHTPPHQLPPLRPPPVINWRPLQNIPVGLALEEGDHPIKALRATIARMPPQPDLSAFNDYLLTAASLSLGVRKRRLAKRHPWMSNREVRTAHTQYLATYRTYNKRRNSKNKAALNRQQRLFRRARNHAIRVTHDSYLRKLEKGNIPFFYAYFKKQRKPHTSSDHPNLDSTAAVATWRRIFTRDPASTSSIADLPPYVDNIIVQITEAEVKAAINSSKSSASGPDGLDIRLLKSCQKEVTPLLAVQFTAALTAFPSELKLGKVLLFPKTKPPSADPLLYRPIILIAILARLFYKIIDTKLRAYIFLNVIFYACQAGFVPNRSTHDQALIIHTLAACQRARTQRQNSSLYAGFLDLEKAFDTISHEELMDVMENRIRLPQQYLEIVRRILIGNRVELFGHIIDVTRGCLQGGPLSPLLCLCMLHDLCAYLMEQRPPPSYPLSSSPPFPPSYVDYWHLLSILLFADDVAFLATDPAVMQWYLDHATAWAIRRKLRFSPKSRIMRLACQQALASAIRPSFRLQGFDLKWETDLFRYLGHPVRAHQPGRPIDYVYPPNDMPTLHHRFHALLCMFSPATGCRRVSIPALLMGIKQVIIAKALYPSCVVRTDGKQLDSAILGWIRTILQLPPDTPSVLIQWELQLWPTDLYVDTRILHYARPFFALWFNQFILRPLHRGHPASTLLTGQYGPVHRIFETLHRYDLTDHPSLSAPPSKTYNGDRWKVEVRGRLTQEYWRYLNRRLLDYPQSYRDQIKEVCPGYARSGRPGAPPLPEYIMYGGDMARIGLRFKGHGLRRLHQPRTDEDRPDCLWCGAHCQECGPHLIRCPALPADLATPLADLLARISRESSTSARARPALLQRLTSLYWPNMTRDTTRQALSFLGRCINRYSSAWQPAHPEDTSPNPIWRVKIQP